MYQEKKKMFVKDDVCKKLNEKLWIIIQGL